MAKECTGKKRRIVKAKVNFLSLCPKGANTLRTAYKSADGQTANISVTSIFKEMDEKGEIIACVYAPGIVDYQGDMACEEVIKEMAHDFAKNGIGIDIRHNEQVIPKDEAFVAESFIIQKSDPRFSDMKNYDNQPVDVTGGWGVVIKVEDERLKELYRKGDWAGISLGGFVLTDEGAYDNVDKNVIQKVVSFVKEYLTKNTEKKSEIDMDKAELVTVLADNNAALVKALKEALTPAPAQKQGDQEQASTQTPAKVKGLPGFAKPTLKESPTEADLEMHSKKLEVYQLSLAVDPDSIESIRAFQVAAKEIMSGKTEQKGKKEETDVYASFITNQNPAEVAQKSADGSDAAVLALVDALPAGRQK